MRNHTNSSPLKSIGECTVKRQSQQTATVPPAREPTIDTVPTRTYTQAPKASQYTQTRILATADRGSSFRHQQIHTEWFTHCVHCVRILHISLYLRIQQKLLRVEKFTVNTYFALCVLIAHPYTYRCMWISFSICFGLLQNRIFGCWLLFFPSSAVRYTSKSFWPMHIIECERQPTPIHACIYFDFFAKFLIS